MSSKSYGKPHIVQKEPKIVIQYQPPTIFTKWGDHNEKILKMYQSGFTEMEKMSHLYNFLLKTMERIHHHAEERLWWT